MTTALADARQREHDEGEPRVSLIVGHKIRCPRCLNVADMMDYFTFDQPERFVDQLNTVLKCRAKRWNRAKGQSESCRCVFSVADPIPVIVEERAA